MLEKVSKIVLYVMLALGVVVSVVYFAVEAPSLQSGLDEVSSASADVKISTVNNLATDWGGFILNACIFLTFACIVLFIGFALYKLVMDAIDEPKNVVKPLIAIGGLAIIFVLSYLFASNEVPQTVSIINSGIQPSSARLSETMIIATYFLFALPIVALVYGELSKLWK